jgi:inhibitor of KinA sporulation pathway (predicted exonuclease)
MAILIIDIEATCCDDGSIPPSEQEAIEIGAIIAAETTKKVVDAFSVTIKPTIHPELTSFCEDLTGITQDDISCALTFPEVWGNFKKRCLDFRPARFMSWGTIDKRLLSLECERHGQDYFLPKHVDLAGVFTKHTGKRRGRRGALKYLHLETPPRANHRGLDDAHDVHDLWRKMSTMGWLKEK